jgi:hypothetical protein
VTIGILQENLHGTVWPPLRLSVIPPLREQALLRFLDRLDHQREMAFARRQAALWITADEMKLLVHADAKPGARKRERRTRHRIETEDFGIESLALADVVHVKSNMVELSDPHNGSQRSKNRRWKPLARNTGLRAGKAKPESVISLPFAFPNQDAILQ